MKKQLVWLTVVVTAMILAAFNKPLKNLIAPEKTVSKNISFAFFKADNYNAAIYNDASASLQVAIVKIRGNQRKIVWQKEYDAKLLKEYPSFANALAEKVVVDNVVDSKDKLMVVYTLTYNDNGSRMQLRDGTIISKGEKDGKLFINI